MKIRKTVTKLVDFLKSHPTNVRVAECNFHTRYLCIQPSKDSKISKRLYIKSFSCNEFETEIFSLDLGHYNFLLNNRESEMIKPLFDNLVIPVVNHNKRKVVAKTTSLFNEFLNNL